MSTSKNTTVSGLPIKIENDKNIHRVTYENFYTKEGVNAFERALEDIKQKSQALNPHILNITINIDY